MGYLQEVQNELVLQGYSKKNKRTICTFNTPIRYIIRNTSFMM